MTRQHPLWRILALLGALSLFAAACGDDDEPSAEGGGDETTTTTEAEEEEPAAEGDGVLKFGTLLPETGSLAYLGPPEIAAAKLAVEDINAAGGVLGEDVTLTESDSGDTSTDIASQSVDRLLGEDVDAIIGAASSGVTLTVIDTIVGEGVIQFSPANTATDLTDYEDDGLYFRTAPPDVFQGTVLGEVIAEEGATTLGILALDDPYGTGLADQVTEAFEGSGGEVVETIIYDPQAQTFDAEVQQMVTAAPEAIAVLGFDESARLIQTMVEQGIGPSDVSVYGSDGNMGNALGEGLAPGTLTGMRGTQPFGERAFGEFQDRLLEQDPALEDFNYGGETYDAVVITALAAIVAGTDESRAVAEEINGVTADGETCEDFAACVEILDAGGDIDYDGISGPGEFTDVGEPSGASFGILEFGPDNQIIIPVEDFRLDGF